MTVHGLSSFFCFSAAAVTMVLAVLALAVECAKHKTKSLSFWGAGVFVCTFYLYTFAYKGILIAKGVFKLGGYIDG